MPHALTPVQLARLSQLQMFGIKSNEDDDTGVGPFLIRPSRPEPEPDLEGCGAAGHWDRSFDALPFVLRVRRQPFLLGTSLCMIHFSIQPGNILGTRLN
jgi:hypothetical protein